MTKYIAVALVFLGCQGGKKDKPDPGPGTGSGSGSAAGSAATRNEIGRPEFNELAVRANLPVFWIGDANQDRNVDDNEVAKLLFYPPIAIDLDAAYAKILAIKKQPLPDRSSPEGKRRGLVIDELAQGRAALVANDLSAQPEAVKAFLHRMLEVALRIDALYQVQNGAAALASQLPPNDTESASLFRRNMGPKCVAPKTETEKECSAIRGAPEPMVDVYPETIGGVGQNDPDFCKKLEARPDAKALLEPFTTVRDIGGKLTAVPYTETYMVQMGAIAGELDSAAAALEGANEDALVAYLRAAANGFRTNDWWPADEAWAAMNASNSKWYVRVGPDETYWEPCAHKAGFHLTLALIDQDLKQWQDKLVPIQQEMETAIAARAGAPYKARQVTFHLPDFIDIVINAGDDRSPLGATIGQSLPNVGPVAKESRGRTVAMANLYTDADSIESARAAAASLLDTESMKEYVDDPLPGLLSTTLHEATHNLGPAQEYAIDGKPVEDKFGGPMDQLIEELKAQTGALFLVETLRGKGIVSDTLARQIYVQSMTWAFGQISNGMYTTVGHQRKTYPQLAAIQVGYLLDMGALTWDPDAAAANGTDKGAFKIHLDKMVAVSDELMKTVAGIKARGDVRAAEALAKKYVDGKVVPFDAINERYRRLPRNSFVYSLTL
jgi:hypothetical protein